MLNQVRTLLLHRSGLEADSSSVGEEYVPPDFRPVTLSTTLENIWLWLFARNPDRAFLNWRLREFMTLLHAPDLEGFTLKDDARVSYLPLTDNPFHARLLAGPVVTPLAGTTAALYVLGSTPLASQRLEKRWDVTVVDASNIGVTSWDEDNNLVSSTLAYTSSGGLTDLLALPGSSLNFYLEPVVSASWRINVLARPAVSLAALATQARQRSDPERQALFGGADQEPYRSYRLLWDEHPQSLYALTGILLAWAERAREAQDL